MSSADLSVSIARAVADIDAVLLPQDVVARLISFSNRYGLTGGFMLTHPIFSDATLAESIIGAVPGPIVAPLLKHSCTAADILRAVSNLDVDELTWAEDRPFSPGNADLRAVADCIAVENFPDGVLIRALGASGLSGVTVLGGNATVLDAGAIACLKVMTMYAYDRATALLAAQVRERYGLSEREFECMQWVSAGKTDWEIGQILTISPKTVNYHVENAKRKMEVQTRVQAVIAALRSGGIEG